MSTARGFLLSLVTVALASAMLAACGGADDDFGGRDSRRQTTETVGKRSSPGLGQPCGHGTFIGFVSSDATSERKVSFHRGGEAVLEFTAQTSPNGVTVGGHTFRASAKDLERVRSGLAESHLSSLAYEYRAGVSSSDARRYMITDCRHDVYVDAAAIQEGRAPRPLARLVQILDALVEPQFERALAQSRG